MTQITFTAGLRPDRAIVAVTGGDARHFLHNLLTADIEGLAAGQARYAALLTPQGKILFDLFIVPADDGFLIDCAASRMAELLKRLNLYKLRAKVSFTSRDDLAVAVSPIAVEGGYPDPRLPDIGWRCYTAAGSRAVSADYDAARIALGLADSDADIGSGDLFPHEANLDQLGAVSFTKGCYIGQEVVSRMEHRGTARSRILPLRLSAPPPAKGSEIRSGDKLIGTLLSSAGGRALGLIRLDRLAECTAPLLTDAVTVTVLKPRWVAYDVPGAEEMR
ncbi:MAG: folate-binding protein YgfZ [Alphaproteobacteria bacterium]|nr:folate-binding protein YgfZ [Alphaproteobacteria bacterium]